jgi:hypothetical protein
VEENPDMSSVRSDVALLMPPDPLRDQGYQDTLRAIRPDNDPEKPPPREPGDKWILIAVVAGAAGCGILGVVVAILFGFATIFINLSVGVIGGGIIGALIGDLIKKRMLGRNRSRKT